ncbi:MULTISPECIES: 4Fe-4S dicluster domain-containing protein [Prosthecochloris]|uniref:4Fe-4S dicluster domain-containing protein n=1 Tax=Prosthecochloris vibrioformis TaxID=1098 RepID=A0A5C4RYI6_PROVB|nr:MULTISPECIES: 4Fe-4S dicluster domain-containing protein [Prosthecochloris]ANT64059.1 Indolepyruvate ferredoxin oxidoreductase, alpha and beta subunit protein [Prosthecochloris sp. CIB 2401]TNJ36343.1 4Fe-4S dicluster domain-containing protein [Prosthecochloris vibrioformis]
MAEPVKQSGAPKPVQPAGKPKPGAAPAGGQAPKGAPAAKGKPAPKQAGNGQQMKGRLAPLDVNLGRTGRRMESALPIVKPKPKVKPAPKAAAPKGAPKGAPKAAPKGAPVAKGAPPPKAPPAAKGAPAGATPKPIAKKAPRAKKHYFILENLCVGCGLCLDKCPPKVNAIGYKFYGDVQEGGFRCYIDQDACISCSACFSSDECPSGALVEILPSGEVLDFTYTPPERLDFDLRFLHRFHRESKK